MGHFLSQRVLACVCVSLGSFFITGCGSVSAVRKTPTYNLHGNPQMSGAVVRSELRFKLSEGNILITVGDRTIQGQMDMSLRAAPTKVAVRGRREKKGRGESAVPLRRKLDASIDG